MAEEKHWAYDLVAGNNTLLKKLVDGEWDEKNFLVVPPNCCAVESYDEEIMKGANSAHMLFEKDKIHVMQIDTPYGAHRERVNRKLQFPDIH